ncbi:MAG: 4Fe-4S binding protein [Clostridia bacterium]|nr:4Fe-4S binding protein [Clostridia bacterium]
MKKNELENKNGVGGWIRAHLPTKRRLIQLYAALLFNANLKGFGNGYIYLGPLKNICTPGLNCYSCPGASGACPLGSLQNALTGSNKRAPYYVFGIILLYGILLGRWICGFLCPFGLIQDLLHKIKTPKLKKSRFTRVLSYLKYVILGLFVIYLPLVYAFRKNPAVLPAFCKYICPAGTLEGAVGLLSNALNADLLSMLGPLFTWKFVLMVVILVAAVFIYRVFCRFLCPLGALYGLFNKIAICGIKLEKPKCVDCGLCVSKCKMDIRHVGDHECINCGECISVCPTQAITWKGSKFFLPPDEIGETDADRARIEERNARIKKRNRVIGIAVTVALLGLLAGALVYYNVIDKAPVIESTNPEQPDVGNSVGNVCHGAEIPLINAEGSFNVQSNGGKVTVLNFWYLDCQPCKEELPHFNEIAKEYADSVTVIAVCANFDAEFAPDFVAENYGDYSMLFGVDLADEGYYNLLGGKGTYPMTLIIDESGVITAKFYDKVSYEDLKTAIDVALAEE